MCPYPVRNAAKRSSGRDSDTSVSAADALLGAASAGLSKVGWTVGTGGPAKMKMMTEQIQHSQSWPAALAIARGVRKEARKFIDSYGGNDGRFTIDWMVLRNHVPLQVRLMVEQELWRMGEPWKGLVTGFRPISKI